MPKLQIIGPADPVNLPTASPESFGAGVGRAMQETGRTTQALGQVMDALGQQRAKTRAAQYESDLRAEASKILSHPNIEEREGLFDQAQRRLYEHYRKGSWSRNTFDSETGFSTNEIRTRFTGAVAQDAVRVAVSELDDQLALKAQAAAESDDPEQRLAQSAEAEIAIHSAGQRGLLAPWEVSDRIGSFRKEVRNSVTRRLINDDPAEAIQYLRSGGFDGTVLEREEFESQALREIRVRAQHERAEEGLQIRLQREAERKVSRAAENDLMSQYEQDGYLPMESVTARGGELTGSARRRMEILARGPKSSAPGTSARMSKLSLYEMALSGEDVEGAVGEAVVRKQIKPGDRTFILNANDQPEWRGARMAIVEFVKKANSIGPANADKAIDQFEEWAGAHPSASAREAETVAREIVVEQSKRLPKGTSLRRSVYGDKDMIDVDATLTMIDGMLASGAMSPTEHNEELQKLMKIDKWQEYRMSLDGGVK